MTEAWFDPSAWDISRFTRQRDTAPFALPEVVAQAFDQPIPAPRLIIHSTDGYEPPTPPIFIPGMVGELVAYCWNNSPHQIAEVSISSALSIMSLLCSRQYRHGSLGMSLYILLLCKSSIGKSFCFKANDTLFQQLIKMFDPIIKNQPTFAIQAKERQDATKLMIVGGVGSAEGIEQHFADAPTMLLHADEFVHSIKEMASPRCSSVLANIQILLVKMVEMCNVSRVYRGKKYSKRSGKVVVEDKDIFSASLTLLATGIPSDFYDDLTPKLVTSGFVPRFAIIEYHGYKLPPLNSNEVDEVPEELLNRLFYLLSKGFDKDTLKEMTGEKSDMIDVGFVDEQAKTAYDRWFAYCTDKQNAANRSDIASAPLWSRAKANVAKIASLIAIGCNIHMPQITQDHVNIAIAIIRPALEKLTGIIESGQIGDSDNRLGSHIKDYMARMYVGGYAKFGNVKMIRQDLLDSGIIQVAAVRNYCLHLAAFRNHKNGANRAFNDAFDNLIRYGEVKLVDVPGNIKTKCVELNLPAFDEELKRTSKSDIV
jgi:hypothetical protein